MYQVELSSAAVEDLNGFSAAEIQEILSVLLGLEGNPKPGKIQVIPLEEAVDGMAYLYETEVYRVFYDIFETARVVKVVAIFRRISLN